MERGDIQAWLSNKECLATRVASNDLKGLFGKKLTVPAHTVGLLSTSDAKPRVLKEGEDATGKFEAVLVKLGELPVRFRFTGLRSSDDVPVDVNATLYVQIEAPDDTHLGDFCRNLFSRGDNYVSSDITAYLNFDVKRDLAEWIASKDADSLGRVHELSQAADRLKATLERSLFGKGLAFRKLGDLDVDSPELKKYRDDKRKDKVKIEAHEEDLRDQERKGEKIDKLVGMLQSEPVQKILDGIKDEKARGVLYTYLVEQDLCRLTPHEASQKLGSMGDEVLGALLRALTNAMGGGAPDTGILGSENCPERKTRWIMTVSGMTVFAFSPTEPKPVERFRFEEPLRSARVLSGPEGDLLVAGGKRSVFARPLTGDGKILPFHFPTGKKPKGGTNSAAAWNGWLFATHSEFGVARWKLSDPGSTAQLICPEATAGNQTTRGVLVTPEGLLYFASGPYIFSVDLKAEPLAPVQHTPQAQGAVTAVALGQSLVFAACGDGQEGSVLAWRAGESQEGKVVLRRNDPILAVRLARIGGVSHVLYAAKDHSLYARVVGQNLETAYDAGEYLVSMIEGSSELLCGVDQTGMHVLFWHATSPKKPYRVLEVSQFSEHPVYDVTLRPE